MPVNEYRPFATAVGANVLDPAAYAALADRLTGFTAGLAKSEDANTPWRQASVATTALAQMIVDQTGADMFDDGDPAAFKTKLVAAINAIISGGTVFATAAEILALNATKPINGAGLFAAANFQVVPFASPSLTWDAKVKGLNVDVVLSGSTQLGTISNLTDGQPLIFAPMQDSTGGRLLTYSSQHVFPGNVAPTLSTAPDKQDFLFGFYKASINKVIWPGFLKAS